MKDTQVRNLKIVDSGDGTSTDDKMKNINKKGTHSQFGWPDVRRCISNIRDIFSVILAEMGYM